MDAAAITWLAVAHCLIDTFALMIQPLWPDLQARLAMSDPGTQVVYLLWSLSTSLSQFGFGIWADRYGARWMVGGGLVVAIVAISLIGLASTPAALVALLFVAGLGIGAFHPEAAAMVGACAPKQRSRGMSIFVIGGAMGLALGPIYSGVLTSEFGMTALLWSIPWGLAVAALATWGLRRVASAHVSALAGPARFSEVIDGKLGAILWILVIGTLRVVPAVGILQALAFMLKARGESNASIGLAQSIFQIASAGGAFGCALFVRQTSERLALWLLPLLAIPAIMSCGSVSYPLLLVLLAIAGLLLGGAGPVLISYAQQMLPNGQRMASSITMGVSWGFGGAIVALGMGVLNSFGRPDLAFVLFAPAVLLSSVLCLRLPAAEKALPPAAVGPAAA